MRADRLITLLMLLQTHRRLTASQLAAELEVSERTVYRDIDALCIAGIPIVTESGPGGGVGLLDDYRTRLTGLTDAEIRALFMLSIPAPLADLGLGQELKAALLKLTASLPDARRVQGQQVRQRLHLDSTSWAQAAEPVPHLHAIYQAVTHDQVLWLAYRLPFDTAVERQIAPYGLVAKAGSWYVVGGRGEHTVVVRVSEVVAVHPTGETFTRPAEFDLAAYWAAWCAGHEQNRPQYPVTARIAPALIPQLRWLLGDRLDAILAEGSLPGADGWRTVTLMFESLEAARERILGFGRAIEILEPHALRCTVIDFAAQIVDFYAGSNLT